jgi:hypothetical protein
MPRCGDLLLWVGTTCPNVFCGAMLGGRADGITWSGVYCSWSCCDVSCGLSCGHCLVCLAFLGSRIQLAPGCLAQLLKAEACFQWGNYAPHKKHLLVGVNRRRLSVSSAERLGLGKCGAEDPDVTFSS